MTEHVLPVVCKMSESEHYLGVGGPGLIDSLYLSQSFPACSICRNFILDTSGRYITECNHTFHELCLKQWLFQTESCPNCRTLVFLDTVDPTYRQSQFDLEAQRFELEAQQNEQHLQQEQRERDQMNLRAQLEFERRYPYRKIIIICILLTALVIFPGIPVVLAVTGITYFDIFGVYLLYILAFIGYVTIGIGLGTFALQTMMKLTCLFAQNGWLPN